MHFLKATVILRFAVAIVTSKSISDQKQVNTFKNQTADLILNNVGHNAVIHIDFCCNTTSEKTPATTTMTTNPTPDTTTTPIPTPHTTETTTPTPDTTLTTTTPTPNSIYCDKRNFTPSEGKINPNYYQWLVLVFGGNRFAGRGYFLTPNKVLVRNEEGVVSNAKHTVYLCAFDYPTLTLEYTEDLILTNYSVNGVFRLSGLSVLTLKKPVSYLLPLCLPEVSTAPEIDYYLIHESDMGKNKWFFKMQLSPFEKCKGGLSKEKFSGVHESDVICAEVKWEKERPINYVRGIALVQKDTTGKWTLKGSLLSNFGNKEKYLTFLNVQKNIDRIIPKLN